MGEVRLADVTEASIDVERLRTAVRSHSAGAVVEFYGEVRDHDHGHDVASLTYEAHPSAQRVLAEVAAQVAGRSDVLAVAVVHRVGPVGIGEAALVAVVSAVHRDGAFTACRELVDETKARLPIWKHQVFADGSDEWVNCA